MADALSGGLRDFSEFSIKFCVGGTRQHGEGVLQRFNRFLNFQIDLAGRA